MDHHVGVQWCRTIIQNSGSSFFITIHISAQAGTFSVYLVLVVASEHDRKLSTLSTYQTPNWRTTLPRSKSLDLHSSSAEHFAGEENAGSEYLRPTPLDSRQASNTTVTLVWPLHPRTRSPAANPRRWRPLSRNPDIANISVFVVAIDIFLFFPVFIKLRKFWCHVILLSIFPNLSGLLPESYWYSIIETTMVKWTLNIRLPTNKNYSNSTFHLKTSFALELFPGFTFTRFGEQINWIRLKWIHAKLNLYF
jgi:hypothetical protein